MSTAAVIDCSGHHVYDHNVAGTLQVEKCRARQSDSAYARALEFLQGHGVVKRKGSVITDTGEVDGEEEEREDAPPEPIVEDEADDQDLAVLAGIRRHGFLWHMWANCGWFTIPMTVGIIIEVCMAGVRWCLCRGSTLNGTRGAQAGSVELQLLILAWWSDAALPSRDSKNWYYLGLYAILLVTEIMGAYFRQVVCKAVVYSAVRV